MTAGGGPACLSIEQIARLLAAGETCDGEARQHLSTCAMCSGIAARFRDANSFLLPLARALPAAPADLTLLSPMPSAGLRPDSFTGYEILQEIHRGGQGVVYQAIQKSTRQKVAIKVMREGPFAGAGDKARFEREVQILGQLNHPNIVGIHDSGLAGGCHFFVMDYISGQPLDVYMAREKKSIEDTLDLFGKICDAVNSAHLRGVIHRDLKPGNIRIDNDGEPHVLDFGLAKVAGFSAASEDAHHAMTMTGQFVGSLPWASPEQAEGIPSKIDIRTDVYSLGVILYQMLTGKFPYDVIGNIRDVLDRIMKAEPARPSTIRKQINDEVETIVLKCLSKERERRYQTAGELARDVAHYRAGNPIEAKRDSAWYVIRKTLRRHRARVAVGIGFLVLLAVSGLVMQWIYQDVQRARMQIKWSNYYKNEHDTKLRQGDPETVIFELDALCQVLWGTSRLPDRARRGPGSINLRPRETSQSPDRKVSEHVDWVLQACKQLPGRNCAEVINYLQRLADDLLAHGDVIDSARVIELQLPLAMATFGEDDLTVARILRTSSVLERIAGHYDEAEARCRTALDVRRRRLNREHPDVAQSIDDLARISLATDNLADAERLFREAVEIRSSILKENHPDYLDSKVGLAATFTAGHRYEDATQLLQEIMYRLASANSARPSSEYAEVRRSAAGAFIELFAARHAAEPDKGYDAKVTVWQAILAKWQAATELEASTALSDPETRK